MPDGAGVGHRGGIDVGVDGDERRGEVRLQQRRGCHEDAGQAVAALPGRLLDERRLQGIEAVAVSQAPALRRTFTQATVLSSLAFPWTVSALVVSADGARALLHHHRKLDRWLQFGGHCDGDEDVTRVAQREALEVQASFGERLIVASERLEALAQNLGT